MQQELEVGLIAALATGEVQTASADIAIATTCTSDVIDVSDRVGSIVGDTGIIEGFALISAPHTTCAIIVNEAEPGFLEDFKRALVPRRKRIGGRRLSELVGHACHL